MIGGAFASQGLSSYATIPKPAERQSQSIQTDPGTDTGNVPASPNPITQTGVRSVKVKGFERMSAADIKKNEGVLVDRLENRGRYHVGPVERLEVKQPRRATAKPFAIATFKSATGKPRSQVII